MQKKTLVVYYSNSGNTRKAAEYIAKAMDAEADAVETTAFGRGFWNYLKRGWYSLRKVLVPIKPTAYDPSKFDLVIVGAPVWAGHVANPIRSYLAEYSASLPKVAFFVTLGGSGAAGALRDMREISGLNPLAELEISEKDRKTNKDVSKMNDYISHFGKLTS